jgi:predicted small secreted protein
MSNTAFSFTLMTQRRSYQQPDHKLSRSRHINHLTSKDNGSQVSIIEIFVETPMPLNDWTKPMPRGWTKSLSMAALLLGAALVLSGCNTISGTVGGVGKDISAIGNTLAGVAGGCSEPRCGGYQRDCGAGGCRRARQVVSGCQERGCGGRGYRAPRQERVSYREQYAYRDRYSSRRDPYCCR